MKDISVAQKKSKTNKPTVHSSPGKGLTGARPRARGSATASPLTAVAAAGVTQHLTFSGSVTSESADEFHLVIDGNEMDLVSSGATSQGKIDLDVGETAKVDFQVGGLSGTDWSVEVDIACDDSPVKLLSQSGTIGKQGNPLLQIEIARETVSDFLAAVTLVCAVALVG
jgi:hypothetical protein